MLEIIGMYGLGAGSTQDALAQIDVPQDGIIRGLDWDAHVCLNADGEFQGYEFSFIAVNQLTSNDVRGRISSVSVEAAFVTSGFAVVGLQKWVGPFELVVSGGERLYLHAVGSAGVESVIRLNLHFDGGAAVTRRSARR